MMKVTAKATRCGGWWVVEVPGVEAALTQARRLDQVSAIVADAVHLVEDVPVEDVEVVLEYEIGDSAALMEARAATCKSSPPPTRRNVQRGPRGPRWRICADRVSWCVISVSSSS